MTDPVQPDKGIKTDGQADASKAAAPAAATQPEPAPAEGKAGEAQQQPEGGAKLSPGSIPLDDKAGGEGEQQDGDGADGQESADDAAQELAFPDGFAKNEKLMEGFKNLAGEMAIKKEGWQKLFDHFCGALSEAQRESRKQLEETIVQLDAKDRETIMNDPAVGGANFKVSQEKVALALKRFGSADLVKSLKTCGMANNPHLFKMLRNIGDYLSEAAPAVNDSATPAGDKRAADVIFG